ncbi:hypothetical protein GCM10022275_22380 [Tessaracoccus defluvii]
MSSSVVGRHPNGSCASSRVTVSRGARWQPHRRHQSSGSTHPKDLDVPDATFTRPDLTTFTRLDGLGLEVTGQLLEPDRAVLACRLA